MSKDGGQAFPQPVTISNEGHEHVAYPGITVRDYFAAKAMQGLLAGNFCNPGQADQIAKDAKAIADAMLAARDVA